MSLGGQQSLTDSLQLQLHLSLEKLSDSELDPDDLSRLENKNKLYQKRINQNLLSKIAISPNISNEDSIEIANQSHQSTLLQMASEASENILDSIDGSPSQFNEVSFQDWHNDQSSQSYTKSINQENIYEGKINPFKNTHNKIVRSNHASLSKSPRYQLYYEPNQVYIENPVDDELHNNVSGYEIDSILDESYEEILQNVNDPYAHLRYQQPNSKLQKRNIVTSPTSASIKLIENNAFFPDDVSDDTLDNNNFYINSHDEQYKIEDEIDSVEINKKKENELLMVSNIHNGSQSVQTKSNNLNLEALFNKKSKTLNKKNEKIEKQKKKDFTTKKFSPRKNQDIIERNKLEVNSKNKKVSSYMQIHQQKKKSLLKKVNSATTNKSYKSIISPKSDDRKAKSAVVEIANLSNNNSQSLFVEDEWLKQAKKLKKIRNKEKNKTSLDDFLNKNVKEEKFKTKKPPKFYRPLQPNSSKLQALTQNKNINRGHFDDINDQESNVYHSNYTLNPNLNKNCLKNIDSDEQSHQTFNDNDNLINQKKFEPHLKVSLPDNTIIQEKIVIHRDCSLYMKNCQPLNQTNDLHRKNENHHVNESFRSPTFITHHYKQLENNQNYPLPPIHNKSFAQYRKYTLNDYKNLQAETLGKKLGGLGADLSSTVKKKDKQKRMVSYSNQLRSRHKRVVAKKKISMHPTHQAEIEKEEEKRKRLAARQRALEYAKEVPKPNVVPPKKLENQQHSPKQDFLKSLKKLENQGDKTFTIKNSSLTIVTDENKISNDFIKQLRERHEKEKEIIARMTALKSK